MPTLTAKSGRLAMRDSVASNIASSASRADGGLRPGIAGRLFSHRSRRIDQNGYGRAKALFDVGLIWRRRRFVVLNGPAAAGTVACRQAQRQGDYREPGGERPNRMGQVSECTVGS